MKNKTKIFSIIRMILDDYLPTILLFLLFLVFIVQISFRYILKSPIKESYEITMVLYMWVVVLAVSQANRKGTHVHFDLIYNLLSPRMKALFTMLGQLIVLVTFVAAFIPTVKYLIFIEFERTPLVHISMAIVFLPVLTLFFFSIVDAVVAIIKSFSILVTPGASAVQPVEKPVIEAEEGC